MSPLWATVTEFVCKSKCLLPSAALNFFDLHAGPAAAESTEMWELIREGLGLRGRGGLWPERFIFASLLFV